MRSRTFLIISAIILIEQGFTQDKPFRFGFKVAPNIAWISPDAKNYENDGSSVGFSWGLLADFALAENYFIKTGINMDYLNGKLEFPYQNDTSDIGTLNRKYNLRYIEIPLTLKMRTNKFGEMAYFGEIGLGSAFNIRAKSQDDYTSLSGEESKSEGDIKNDIAFMKESLIVGAGMEYFIDESTSLVVELCFSNGLNSILKGENTKDPSIKQSAILYYIQLSVGIIF